MSRHLPPPTTNTMDPEQRTRLVRTARKLEALLGTTPQIVELNEYKARRTTIVYRSQFSSSDCSLVSTSSEIEYNRLRPGCHQHTVSAPSTNSPSQNSSPADEKPLKRTRFGPQPLAQPMLLRMSAVPIDKHSRSSSVSSNTVVPSKPLRPPTKPLPEPIHVTLTSKPPLVTPSERRKLKVDSVLGPLSPINKSHFPVHTHSKSRSEFDGPPTLSPSTTEEQDPLTGLSDRDKRIKMAKLQRMMGENIPLELVFKESTSELPAVEKTEKGLRRRSYSLSSMGPVTRTTYSPVPEEPTEKKCKGKGRAADIVQPRPLPTVPISHTHSRSLPTPPHPTPIITQTTTTTTSGPLTPQSSSSMQQKSRKARPRNLTLGADSAIVAADIKLAQQEKEAATITPVVGRGQTLRDGKKGKNSSAKDKTSDRSDAFNNKDRIPNFAHFKTEIWKRKEREWSGEWNVKNMDEVTKALRSLKAS